MIEQPLLYIPQLSNFTTNATGRLSHSTMNTLETCERMYQLEHMLDNGAPREESEHFSFGHGFGEGVAHYLVHQDRDAALLTGWLAYWPQIETEKKNQAKCLNALTVSFDALDNILQDYEVVEFEGKAAVELNFRLNIDDTYYYAGHIDVVLRHRWTGQYFIFEVKTTGLGLHNLEPLYKNSGQALGYSIALDRIVGEKLSSYGVLYFVAQLGKAYTPEIKVLPFDKTLLDRLNWFMTLGLDVERLHRMTELNVFPKRGNACLNYMRPCKHFGLCGLHGMDRPLPHVPDREVYTFEYSMDELVAEHIDRLSNPDFRLEQEKISQANVAKAQEETILDLDTVLDPILDPTPPPPDPNAEVFSKMDDPFGLVANLIEEF